MGSEDGAQQGPGSGGVSPDTHRVPGEEAEEHGDRGGLSCAWSGRSSALTSRSSHRLKSRQLAACAKGESCCDAGGWGGLAREPSLGRL